MRYAAMFERDPQWTESAMALERNYNTHEADHGSSFDIPTPLAVFDPEHKLLAANLAFARLAGEASQATAVRALAQQLANRWRSETLSADGHGQHELIHVGLPDGAFAEWAVSRSWFRSGRGNFELTVRQVRLLTGGEAESERLRDALRRSQAEAEEYRRRSVTDPLTGLRNLAGMADYFSDLGRDRMAGTLVFLDIDDFKSINSRFTHSGGDEVLVSLASLLMNNVRPADGVFRIGGEEIILFLPGMDLSSSGSMLARLRAEFRRATVRFGSAAFSSGMILSDGSVHDLPSVRRLANVLMLVAKLAGKNRDCGLTFEQAFALLGDAPGGDVDRGR